MDRLRVLVLAPDCNPEGVSIPFVAYCHAAALAKLHDVTLVIGSSAENSVRRANAPFHSVEVVRMPLLERIFDWGFRTFLKSNYDTQWLTAYMYPFSLAFEWRVWRQMRRRIFAGEFDVVLRLLPMSPTLPSPFAFFLHNGPIPFVIGPLNGGLRSAPGFSQPDKEKGWSWTARRLYRYVPFARSTYRRAAAIIIASYHMRAEFAAYRDKLFFVPENGIARSLCLDDTRSPEPDAKLELIFVGALVPRKACYVGLRAAAPLLQKELAHFTVIGDGPERTRLEELVRSLGMGKAVSFCGWLSHAEVLTRLRASDVVVLPAIREGGGGVVFEGLASGAVPVILDYGGPGDIVQPEVGYKVPPTSETEVVSQMQEILADLASNRDLLYRLRRQGMSYARECLTWDAKARRTTRVLNWVLRQGPKPELTPSTMLQIERVS
ncbi:MAG TPA: glycosyltransferase family 4 protein [Terriglobales bacterium]|nr:glycosyltransferase family 4 protein [Terriglobales bacterium]